jgi:hypothetical protein
VPPAASCTRSRSFVAARFQRNLAGKSKFAKTREKTTPKALQNRTAIANQSHRTRLAQNGLRMSRQLLP